MANQIRYQVGFDIQQSNLNQLKTSLQQLQKMKISDIMKINNSDAASATNALMNIKNQAAKVEEALKKAFNTKLNTVNIQTFNNALRNSQTSINQVYNTFRQAGTVGQNAFRTLSTSVLSTNIQLKETHNLLDRMATTLTNTLKWNAASAAINGVTRSAQQAWGYIQSLDTSLNNIRIVTGKSADEMANFAVQANNAAKQLGKTTTDYTNAALIYAQQGLSDREVEERAKITLKAANVTGQSTDAVSEQLTAVWNGYKVTAEEAELYVDRLAAVAATTASDLEELSTGMSKVASAAAAMGVGEDQLAAQLSTIISATRQAPESVGTALRTIYARISDIQAGIDEDGVTLGNYSSKMAALGFNVLDVNGHLRDMGDVIQEIGGKWQNLSREQQVSLAHTMAGQRQYNNLLALFDNFNKYNEALNTAQNAAGTLQDQQDIYMESTAAHLQTLKTSVEDIYDSLSDNDGINSLIDGLSNAAGFVARLVDSLGGGGTVLQSLGAIGMTVFSEQIARGISTTITNLQIARDNARQFDQALQNTRNWQGIPGLDEVSSSLLRDREQMLELARVMSPQQFSGLQSLLNDITQVGNELATVTDKQSFLDEAIRQVTTYKDGWSDLNSVLADPTAQEAVIARIKQQEQGFQQISNTLQTYSERLKNLGQASLSGKEISTDLSNMRSELQSYINQLTKMADLGMLERHKEQVKDLEIELSQLDDSVPQSQMRAKLEMIIGQLRGVASNATNVTSDLRQNLQTQFAETTNNIGQQLDTLNQKLTESKGKFDLGMDRAQRAATIEGYAQMASGIARVGASIQQIQNLGSIWKNQDLSTGQKILQTVTNLAFSLPMLITGFSKAATSMKLMRVLTAEEAVAAGLATTAQTAHAFSIHLVSDSATGAAIKVQLLNKTLLLNPAVAVAAGIIALVTALGAFSKAADRANQAAIDLNNEIIETENKRQEELNSNKQLLSSLEDLDQQYKNGEVTRVELRSTIEDLIEQYGLQGQEIDKLSQSYNNLSGYIDDVRKKNAQEALQSAQREFQAAQANVFNIAKGTSKDSGKQIDENTYLLSLARGNSFSDEPTELIQALNSIGGRRSRTGSSIQFQTGFDLESLTNLYDQLNEVYYNIGKTLEPTTLQNSEVYKNLKQWLDQMTPAVEAYRNAIEDVNKSSVASTVINGATNFSSENIKNGNDYLRERSALVSQISTKLNKTEEEASSMVDTYLRENFKDLYSQYDEFANSVEDFREKFGGQNSLVQSLFSGLDDQKFSALMDLITLHPDTLQSWKDLETLIKSISKQDLSNLSQVNLDESQTAAADKYNIYQSLEDQVRGGKTISKKEIESLQPQLQSFFSMMANGSYKMTGDAKEFYETVNGLKLQGFQETIGQFYNEIQRMKSLAAQNFNYEELNQSASRTQLAGGSSVNYTDYNLVQDQLDYLEAVSAGNAQLETMVELWRQQANELTLSKETVDEIAEAVANAGDQTQGLNEKTEELKQRAGEVAHQLHDAMFPTDEDVNLETLESLSETLQDIADESDELSENLTENARDAQDVAESILRFDDAVKDAVDHYDEWMAALNSDSIQQQSEVIDDLRDAYADLLDLDGSSLSNDFLTNTENLNLMKAAIDGDVEAYDELISRAGQDIATAVHLDTSQFQTEFDYLMDLYYQGQSLEDMQIGASLNNQGFLNGLSQMINAAGMTAQQATDYLASMGVDAEVIEQKTQGTETKQITGYHAEPNTRQIPYDFVYLNGTSLGHYTGSIVAPGVDYVPDTETVVDTKENAAFSLKVTSAHKSSGGGFKFNQSKNGGGSGGNARRNPSSKKGGSGGGNKGKKGSGTQADTSKKDPKKPIEDERDIYHDINIQLEQINRNLDRVQKKQERLYGKQLLNNLNEQSKILDQHKAKLEEKHKIQQDDLKQQQQALKNLGVTFDKYGNIANYMSVLGEKQAKINALIKEENSLVNAYNKLTDKEAKKQIADKISEQDKKVKNAEDEYKNLQDRIKNYDDLREDMEDLIDQIEEETQKQIELNIKKFRMELEIRLDLGEAERDWNQFRREVLEHTDVIKDSDFQGIFSDAAQGVRDITSYFNVGGSRGSLEKLTEQLMDTRAQIEAIDKIGNSAIYGDNKAQAMEDLQSDLNELMDQMEDIQGLIDNIDKAYLDTIDDIEDQFDEQIKDYEYVGQLIEHDIDLLSLLYGDKNYDAMDKYFTTLERNNLKQLDSLKRQRDFWKNQWTEATARGDTQAAKQFEENYKETIKNLNETVENAAKNIQDKYINAIDKIFDTLDKKISNGYGTDYLNTEWELMNKNADEYLDTINTAFAIQQTERKYQDAVDDAKSIKNQQALRDLMNEQLDILKNKEKVTQYDIDRAQKLLQVEQARIALENAQSAKTSMRLKRDSQGNYSYQYVADSGAVDEAQANLAQAQNDLYNFDKDRYQSNLDDMLSAWREFQSEYKDIMEDTSLAEQERIEKLALLREQYGEYINDKTTENLVVRNNLMESAFADLAALYNTDVANYNQMSIDEQNILMGDLVPAWQSGIQQMSDKVAGEGGFIPTCEEAFEDLTDVTKDYKNELEDMAKTAEVNLLDIENGVDNLAYSFEGLIENNAELASRMYDELDAISLLKAEAHSLVAEYKAVYDAAKLAVSGIHSFIQAQQNQAAAEAAKANGKSGSGSGNGSSSNSGNKGSSGSNGSGSKSNAAKNSEGTSSPSDATVEGIAGNIWVYGTWGTGADRKNNMIAKFGKEQGEKMYNAVQAKFNSGYGYNGGLEHKWDYYKKFSLSSFRSGGYTGTWVGDAGRLAILHKKEMVLNQEDTKNLLDSVHIMRSVMSNLNGNITTRLSDIKTGYAQMMTSQGDEIEQNVHIEASFPNVDSKREIEEAFNDLVNLAAQRALRR